MGRSAHGIPGRVTTVNPGGGSEGTGGSRDGDRGPGARRRRAAALGRTDGARISGGSSSSATGHGGSCRRCTGQEPSSCAVCRRSGAEVRTREAVVRFARIPASASSRGRWRARTPPSLRSRPHVRSGRSRVGVHSKRRTANPTRSIRAAANVRIAVIDTGADLTAPDLAAEVALGLQHAHRHRRRARRQRPRHLRRIDRGRVGDERRRHRRLRRRRSAARDQGGRRRRDVHGRRRGGRDHVRDRPRREDHQSELRRSRDDVDRAQRDLVRDRPRRARRRGCGQRVPAGNPVEYPAALLQPVGSDGAGGAGLAVGASTQTGRAPRSRTPAPGSPLAAARSERHRRRLALSPAAMYPRSPLPGSQGGLYGYSSGTSF